MAIGTRLYTYAPEEGGDGVRVEDGTGNSSGRGSKPKEVKKAGLFGFFRSSSDYPKKDRQYYESLPLEEKRKLYKCRKNFVTLHDIETWPETRRKLGYYRNKPYPKPHHNPFPLLDKKVSLWRGDITRLEIDAIVNAAKSSLLGGGGVDGAIHGAAGNSLHNECLPLGGCDTGDTKLTSGHALPAKYILHTVGPFDQSQEDLESCYSTCLDLVEKHDIKSVAFCCIATGAYGYPNDKAADVALGKVRKWLEQHSDKVERIIFCVFLEKDLKIYRKKLHQYFPEEIDEQSLLAGSSPEKCPNEARKRDLFITSKPWGSMAIGTSLYTDTPEEEGDRVRVGDGCTENSSGRGSEGQNMARNWDGSDKPIDKPKEVKKAGLFGFFRSSSDYPKKDRQYYESLPLEEKRKLYKCGKNFVTLDDIETWPETRRKLGYYRNKPYPKPHHSPFPPLDKKVSLWRGDITRLEIDAIVNAAKSSLLGGGGVDGAIHGAAGNLLYDECLTLGGCDTGDTKLTSGHALPAKYILHTVGPFDQSQEDLKSCYSTCLDLVKKHDIKSVAFCCIATGQYEYPNNKAADVALGKVRKWLEQHSDKVERIIFCVFLEKDLKIYRKKLHHYFPEEIDEPLLAGNSPEVGPNEARKRDSKSPSEVQPESSGGFVPPGLYHAATESDAAYSDRIKEDTEEIDEQSLLAGSSPEEGPNETRKRDLKSPSESSGGFVPPGLYHAATELAHSERIKEDTIVNKQKLHQYFPEEINKQRLLAGNSPEEGPKARKRDSKPPCEVQPESSGGFVPPGLYHAATESDAAYSDRFKEDSEEIDKQCLLAGNSPEEGPNEARKRDSKSPSEVQTENLITWLLCVSLSVMFLSLWLISFPQ